MEWQAILDVNLNRLTEALKFIEDYTRFELKDLKSLSFIRKTRDEFFRIKKALPFIDFITYRQSKVDLGRMPEFDSIPREDDVDLIIANFTRAKESCRIIEEILRKKNKNLSRLIKKLRFEIYDLEKLVIEKRQRYFNPQLYAILDEKYLDKILIEKTIATLENNGVTMLQLRIKNLSDREFYNYAVRIKRLIKSGGLKFIINNRIDIALACDADGVHLGQDDLSVSLARKILGNKFIIGVSSHNLQQAIRARNGGADYLGIGAVFPTKTKLDAKVCGLDLIRTVSKRVDIPVIGIGGINNKNYKQVLKAGAAGIAVASYLFEGSLEKNLRSLVIKK